MDLLMFGLAIESQALPETVRVPVDDLLAQDEEMARLHDRIATLEGVLEALRDSYDERGRVIKELSRQAR